MANSSTVDQSFIKQFEREVHDVFQRKGSRLRGTLRTVNGVVGMSTTFQVVGKGISQQKARHGKIPVMNPDHTPVECILQDWYTGDWVDRLDELKTNIDERDALTRAAAYAQGRRTDQIIVEAMDVRAFDIDAAATARMTVNKAVLIREQLDDNDVPDDGMRYCAVGPTQWSDLMTIDEFASSDYVGSEGLIWPGGQMKTWQGMHFFMFNGLPSAAADQRTSFAWHHDAVGHAIQADVTTDITWHGDRAAHFIASSLAMGAVVIDGTGCVKANNVDTKLTP